MANAAQAAIWVGKTSPDSLHCPSGSLHVAPDAKESAQRADDQRNHDRGSATAIEVRTDRNRDLRYDNADNASNHHQPAKHRDDDAPVRTPHIVQIDDRKTREQ